MDINKFTANWHFPTAIKAGIGRINDLAQACKELGIQAPLLVTDPGLAALPMVEHAIEHCKKAGLRCDLFSAIKMNPNGENITQGVKAFRQGNHDGIIGLGGGSALDAAKAIALMVGQNRPIWDFEDVGDNYLRVNTESMAPVIAIPTTAGTGSEVGRASVITDENHQIKRIIFHADMLPKIVILDPQLSIGLPAQLTAATGMDALSHALEAYCSPSFHPMAVGIAIEAIRLIKDYLPRAVDNGKDIEARAQVMAAATMGATAFQRGLGAMHALAHPLGAVYDKHHGLLNAILMPYVIKANRLAIEPAIIRLTRYLDLPDTGTDIKARTAETAVTKIEKVDEFDTFLQWIIDLRQQLNIPHSLSDIGITAERADDLGEMAYQDPSSAGNPIAFNAQQYSAILNAAITGEL